VSDGGSLALARSLHRVRRRQRLTALALVLPLLAFLLAVFLLPIGAMLVRAVENPEVATALPRTGEALARWDRAGAPPAAAYAALASDLAALPETAQAGALA
jgi:putative spermidine/putrescine transport system permease protein